MKFGTYFRACSYAMVGSGALALVASGGIGLFLTMVCAVILVLAWKLEDTRWRLSERVGLVIVLLSLPLFYVDWRFLETTGLVREKVGVTALAHLILFLSGVKLLQIKGDRDWVFLYLISFFEVLLAAGLSISPSFFLSLVVYILCALNTVIAFEIQKAKRVVKATETRLLVPPEAKLGRRLARHNKRSEARRLPLVSVLLLGLILLLAAPLFFMMPRSTSAALTRANGGLSGFTGFSDVVRLGDVGRLQQSDQVVMRVRVENPPTHPLRWRGVALDEFTGKTWRKSKAALISPGSRPGSDSGFFAIDTGTRMNGALTQQTFYVEPLDTPVLFAAPRVVALQGPMPYVRVDVENALASRAHDFERIYYRAFSDTTEPDAAQLAKEQPIYERSFQRYLQLPDNLDPRIRQLTQRLLDEAKPHSMYDAVRAIETHLQTNYGYSLDMRASGDDPLADFLFNIREGHCEYFASAMVIMLRTQGIAARLVNGFQTGDYNSTADAYTVTQRDAHSWVEVYFPTRKVWLTFDPTPAAGRPTHAGTGLAARLSKYGEALEMLWIQYVVAYDRSEQRSLTTNAVRRFDNARHWLNGLYESARKTVNSWADAFNDTGRDRERAATRRRVILGGLALVALAGLLLVLARKIRRDGWGRWWLFTRRKNAASAVEFYERMTKALARNGLKRADHETPLEFASATGMPMTVRITDAYHRVRYGARGLSREETAEIEDWLREMEGKGKQ